MAEIKVEKKETSILPWLLLGAGIVALLFWILTDADDSDNYVAQGEVYEEGYELGDAEEDGLIDGYDNDPFEENELLASDGEVINQNGEFVVADDIYNEDEDVIAGMDDDEVEGKLFGNQYNRNDAIDRAVVYLRDGDVDMGIDHRYSHRALTNLINATAAVAASEGVDVDGMLSKARKCAVDITKNPYSNNHADQIKTAAKQITMAIEKVQADKYSDVDVSELKDACDDINVATLALDQKEDIKDFYAAAVDALEEMRD